MLFGDARGVGVEEGYAADGRRFKGKTQRYGGVSALHLAQGGSADTDALG